MAGLIVAAFIAGGIISRKSAIERMRKVVFRCRSIGVAPGGATSAPDGKGVFECWLEQMERGSPMGSETFPSWTYDAFAKEAERWAEETIVDRIERKKQLIESARNRLAEAIAIGAQGCLISTDDARVLFDALADTLGVRP